MAVLDGFAIEERGLAPPMGTKGPRQGFSGKTFNLRNGPGMLRIPHELREEFRDAAMVIDRLITADHSFARLASNYEDVNRAIYRIESGEEPTVDERLEELKKERLKLKDQIAAILAKTV
jgi:uncharacterized protein YdcH (DUF465 family)